MRETWKVSAKIALVVIAVVAAAAVPVFGQSRGYGGPGGGFRRPGEGYRGSGEGSRGSGEGSRGPAMAGGDSRGPGPPTSRYRGPFGSQDGLERFERFLRELDADHDGRIEENEVDGRRRYFVEMMARRVGIEAKFPISVSKFQKAMAKRSSEGGEGSSSDRSESSGGSKPSEDPLVPGFGVAMDLAPLLKFGERAENDSGRSARSSSRSTSRTSSSSASRSSSSRGSSSRGSSSGSSSSRSDSDERYRRWAEVMFRQYDRNHNQRLEKDEWSDRWGEFKEADRNRDGVVKLDELTHRLAGYSRSRSSSYRSRSERSSDSRSSASRSSGSSNSRSGSDDSQRPKPYRLLTPTDRLPEGLPDWFAAKDTNADGQVAMAEFESPGYWTAAAVARFARYDLNHDGMITPGECLEALEQPEEGSEIAKADVGTQMTGATAASSGSAEKSSRPPGLLSRYRRPQSSGDDRREPAPSAARSGAASTKKEDSGGLWAGWDD